MTPGAVGDAPPPPSQVGTGTSSSVRVDVSGEGSVGAGRDVSHSAIGADSRVEHTEVDNRIENTTVNGDVYLAGNLTVQLAERTPAPARQVRVGAMPPLASEFQSREGQSPELLQLQRKAVDEESGRTGPAGSPGRAIGLWDPHDLEVHPAGPREAAGGRGASGARVLPGYVAREHDEVLAEVVKAAAAGRSGMLVLSGSSSTGKTRACWEAVQLLADRGWTLWHPYDPTRARAALQDLHRVAPRTVVWLNEAQHYLGNTEVGEQVAAALHDLLVDPRRAPVLELGTLWPDRVRQYTRRPDPGARDPHSRVRELLAGRILTVPEAFDTRALAAAAAVADKGDRILADALARARTDGRLAQDLAGAPELLDRYRNASPPARALLEAAIDARRLGIGLHLPQAFLTDAAPGYLADADYDALADDWAEQAYAELAETGHGTAPLRRTTVRPTYAPPAPTPDTSSRPSQTTGLRLRLADYLEQHGTAARRALCPPATFWHAAPGNLTRPDDLAALAEAAEARHRLQWAHHLRLCAADQGDTAALRHLATEREKAGDLRGTEALLQKAAGHGDTMALRRLSALREATEDREGAEALARQAADLGDIAGLSDLALSRDQAGDGESAVALAREAADRGDDAALRHLAVSREFAGDREGAEALLREAAARGDTAALHDLARLLEDAESRAGAEALAWELARLGDTGALRDLAIMREKAGDRAGAEVLARKAAGLGDIRALFHLAGLSERAGDRESAQRLFREIAGLGETRALYRLAMLRDRIGDREDAEGLARDAADLGDTEALRDLALTRNRSGDRVGAETLLQEAAVRGDIEARHHLALSREDAGDREGAEALTRQIVVEGVARGLLGLGFLPTWLWTRDGPNSERSGDRTHEALCGRLWPHGLDPGGTPTPVWERVVPARLLQWPPAPVEVG
ncbi:hypothetical protein WN990_39110 [Kitasatospora purpeofusca]|uniref:hypothetical protein n=1 Tax=Kitasatospora purpeofusca TaxID=67352 RepID=UPI0030F24F9E